MTPRLPPAIPLLALAPGCGARTSLATDDPTSADGGSGGAGGAPGSTVVTAGASTAAQATTGAGAGDCTERTLDVAGQGALVVRTDGVNAYSSTADGRFGARRSASRKIEPGADPSSDSVLWCGLSLALALTSRHQRPQNECDIKAIREAEGRIAREVERLAGDPPGAARPTPLAK